MTEKSKYLAQEYVAAIERDAGSVMDVDLVRIVQNTYETAYLRGSVDAIEDYLAARLNVPSLDLSDDARLRTLVRTHQPHEGMIICLDHLRQIVVDTDPALAFEEIAAEQAAFWNHRCLMCGVEAAPGRLCESVDCRRPLHPQWPAVYCCNECALEDV
jgi:hypothetical protein